MVSDAGAPAQGGGSAPNYDQEAAQSSLASVQREAQERLHEAQMQANWEVFQAEQEALQKVTERREMIERTKMTMASALAALELRLDQEYNALTATGYTHARINERTQPLPMPGGP